MKNLPQSISSLEWVANVVRSLYFTSRSPAEIYSDRLFYAHGLRCKAKKVSVKS